MAGFSRTPIKLGPGTLYVAPLGTTEPTAVTGAWPSGWIALGYTDGGSTIAKGITTSPVTVEEEVYAVTNPITGVTQTIAFDLAQATAFNYLLASNAGVGTPGAGTGLVAATTGTNPDGSIWVEDPGLGLEVRIMVGWDALPKAGTVGDPFGRFLARQCLQTGTITETHKKAPQKDLYTTTWTLELPTTGLNPYRKIYPASLAS